MSSPRLTESNRANSLHSTGPVTPEGKRRSSLNALKHGIFSRLTLLPDEDPDELEILRTGLVDDYQPVGGAEELLVDRIVGQTWRLRRLELVEVRMFATNKINPREMEMIRLYEGRLENGLFRAMKELNNLRRQRLQQAAAELAADPAAMATAEEKARQEANKRSYRMIVPDAELVAKLRKFAAGEIDGLLQHSDYNSDQQSPDRQGAVGLRPGEPGWDSPNRNSDAAPTPIGSEFSGAPSVADDPAANPIHNADKDLPVQPATEIGSDFSAAQPAQAAQPRRSKYVGSQLRR